jgi:hypothetical protein
MKTPAWLGFILTVGAVLEITVGLGLLLIPALVAELLLRAPLEGAGLVVARLAGGGLLAVGLACWAARRTPTTPTGLGVCRAFLAYNVVAVAVLFRAYPPLPGGLAALGAGILHFVVAVALLAALYDPGGPRAES